jgi:hypothetical protein
MSYARATIVAPGGRDYTQPCCMVRDMRDVFRCTLSVSKRLPLHINRRGGMQEETRFLRFVPVFQGFLMSAGVRKLMHF